QISLSPCHLVTLSPCHPLTPSPPHRLTLDLIPGPLALPVGPDLLLPDRSDLLDPVHDLLGRCESLVAMRRGDDDQHRRLADLQAPDPMVDRHHAGSPA